jgi:hypothetical protein
VGGEFVNDKGVDGVIVRGVSVRMKKSKVQKCLFTSSIFDFASGLLSSSFILQVTSNLCVYILNVKLICSTYFNFCEVRKLAFLQTARFVRVVVTSDMT